MKWNTRSWKQPVSSWIFCRSLWRSYLLSWSYMPIVSWSKEENRNSAFINCWACPMARSTASWFMKPYWSVWSHLWRAWCWELLYHSVWAYWRLLCLKWNWTITLFFPGVQRSRRSCYLLWSLRSPSFWTVLRSTVSNWSIYCRQIKSISNPICKTCICQYSYFWYRLGCLDMLIIYLPAAPIWSTRHSCRSCWFAVWPVHSCCFFH